MNLDRRRLLAVALAGLTALIGLAICDRRAKATLVLIEADVATTYDLDGMLVVDHPRPRARPCYQGDATPHQCCDTVEMFNTLLKPGQAWEIRAAPVQGMGQVDWGHPRGYRLDAKADYYVFGSRRRGSMRPTVVSFWLETDVRTFTVHDGGKLLHCAEVMPDIVDLSGDVLHDGRM